MHSETLLSLFLPVLPTLLRWHVSRLTNGGSQLPYGSGETIGELVLRTQAERKAATLRVI